MLTAKADVASVAEALRRKADQTDMAAVRLAVADAGGAAGAGTAWVAAMARLESELSRKADGAHVSSLSDSLRMKASQDVLDAVDRRVREAEATVEALRTQLQRLDEMQLRTRIVEERSEEATRLATDALDRVAAIPFVSVGRWIWKSRDLTDTSLVPWDVQLYNASPDTLQWSPGSATVVTVKPGLYRISVGVFAARVPALTLMVDGSPVVSTADVGGADGSGGATVVVHRHPAGSVAGVSLVQFLSLPGKASVGVLFDGEARGQGFLEVRKI